MTDHTDPFASAELEAGRLPKIVDEWLNEQVRQGATVDDIRNKLDMTDAERREVSKTRQCWHSTASS